MVTMRISQAANLDYILSCGTAFNNEPQSLQNLNHAFQLDVFAGKSF